MSCEPQLRGILKKKRIFEAKFGGQRQGRLVPVEETPTRRESKERESLCVIYIALSLYIYVIFFSYEGGFFRQAAVTGPGSLPLHSSSEDSSSSEASCSHLMKGSMSLRKTCLPFGLLPFLCHSMMVSSSMTSASYISLMI